MGITSSLTGLSIPAVKLLYGGLITHGLLGLLWPGSPTFDPANTRDFMKWALAGCCAVRGAG